MSFYRPTGRLDPAPADLAYGALARAALEYQARRGKIILLSEDETILWRFALLRAGWWRTTQRARIPTRPLSHSQITRDEALKATRGGGIAGGVDTSGSGRVPARCGEISQAPPQLSYRIKRYIKEGSHGFPGSLSALVTSSTRGRPDARHRLRSPPFAVSHHHFLAHRPVGGGQGGTRNSRTSRKLQT